MKGVPAHLKGQAKRALKELINAGYVIPKPTGYGLRMSINPRMVPEVERLLGM